MKTKICKKCLGDPQALSEFYKCKNTLDGHTGACKTCIKLASRKYREANLEYVKAYDRNRPNYLERNASNLERRKHYSLEQLEAERLAKLAWAKRNRIKKNAHQAVRRSNLTAPTNCEHCNTFGIDLEAHHADYNKPLEVIWLCITCHGIEHKRLTNIIAH